MTDKDNLQSSQ